MRRETVLKVILVVIIGIMLLAKPLNVFADSTDLNDFWEDQGGLEDIGGTTETPTETPSTPETPTTTPEPTPSTPSTTPSTETKEELPKAGLAEDTMMVVAIFGLIATATFAYKKTSEYNEI